MTTRRPDARPRGAWASFVVLCIFLGLALFGAGCTDPGEHLLLWHAYRGAEETALGEIVQRFEREHPGVTIDVLAIPFGAYEPKLAAAVPHGHGPDVFISAHDRLGIYRRENIVAPVGEALPESDVSSFDAVAISATTQDGVRYAVPLAEKTLALYVNEALVPEPLAAMDDVAALRARLPEGSYPLAYDTSSLFFHAPFLHAFGGAALDAQDHFAFVGPKAAASVELVHQWVKARVIPEEPNESLVAQLFASGRAATVLGGPSFASDVHGDVHYRVVPLPTLHAATAAGGEGTMRPYLTVEGAFVTPTGAKSARALELARFLGGKVSGEIRAREAKQVVPRDDVMHEPDIAGDVMVRAFHEAATAATPMPTSPAMRATWVPAGQAILKVLRGDLPAEAALDEAAARFADVMRPPPPPPSPTPALLAVGGVLLALAFVGVRRARDQTFRSALRASKPAYAYVAHAVLVVLVLVVLPLAAGAVTSLFVGTADAPRYVGLGNYASILTARGGPLLGHGSFYLTLLVTVLWTVVNVAFHVGIGLVLGLALSRPWLKLRAAYRVVLILPWAVPSYVTALAWKGMFHRQFGAINAILRALGAEPVSWFSHFSTAFAANVTTNVWLGFPFMMVVTLGALTSISKDVLEAAEVDGATRWQRFRLVTLPLLGPVLLPSVVLGSVWTFNMFNVVFLVSGGEPDGATDILVSEAYRWAFTRDAQYGYAAAYAVLIFVLLAFGTRLLGRVAGGRAEAT